MNAEAVLPKMQTVPKYFGTKQWNLVLGGAWVALCNYSIGQEEHRKAFEKETGHSLLALVGRDPISAMIDKATGREETVLAAWCDWVTRNLWGEAEQADSDPESNSVFRKHGVLGAGPSPESDPIGWRKWWMIRNPGKTWADAGEAWRAAVE